MDLNTLKADDFRVEKMKFGQMKFGKKDSKKDPTVIHYNDKITLSDIPMEVYQYEINGKPAVEWVMDRQCVKVDKKSGLVNDANDYEMELLNNPKYPLQLLRRVMSVAVETQRIIQSLPKLNI